MAKILLADDSGHAQRMGAKILTAEGHEVATVSNGQAAIKTLKDSIPDLIVADVFMPGKTGYEVCQFIKSDPKLSSIPVVLIVGAMEPYDPMEGERVHADGVITKPLESSDLVATVQKLLAAVKKRVPPPPPEPAAPEPVAVEASKSGAEMPAFRSFITSAELEIPEEMRQQPVSMMGDLLEPSVAPADQPGMAAELTPVETPAVEAVPLEQLGEVPWQPVTPDTEPEKTETEPLLAAPESYLEPELPAAVSLPEPEPSAEPEMLPATLLVQELSPAPSPWTAQSVEVTEEDKKLFEPPPPDWQGLVSMVQEEEGAVPFPAAFTAVGRPGPVPEVPPTTEPPAVTVLPVTPGPISEEHSIQESERLTPEAAVEKAVPAPPTQAPSAPFSDTIAMLVPKIAPLDYSTIEQVVRETVEEMMPQIMDRIAQATGLKFAKEK